MEGRKKWERLRGEKSSKRRSGVGRGEECGKEQKEGEGDNKGKEESGRGG